MTNDETGTLFSNKNKAFLDALSEHKTLDAAYLFYGECAADLELAATYLIEKRLQSAKESPNHLRVKTENSIKIEDIRALIEKTKYGSPNQDPLFVTLCDAHTFTVQAANAFLKTLETPPNHVIFILTTTQPKAILPTIWSRCQPLYFPTEKNKTKSEKKHIPYTELKKKSLIDQLSALEILAENKESAQEALYEWIQELTEETPPNIYIIQRIVDTLEALHYNTNTRLQLEGLLLKE